MATGIAHDLKNPLSIVMMATNIMAKKYPEITETQVVEKNLKKMDNIISTYLNIIHQEENHISEFNLLQVCEDAVSLSSEKLSSKKIPKPIVQFEKNIILNQKYNELLLILVNLISNSSDAIESNEERWIKIQAIETSNSKEVKIIFSDSGQGISSEIFEKMFERQFSTKSKNHDSGLGLYLVKKMCDEMSGTIEYLPHLENTSFQITFQKNS